MNQAQPGLPGLSGARRSPERTALRPGPTICLMHMSTAQKRAYTIADNRLSEIGGTWDKKLLALEHEAIRLLDPQFDLTATS